MPDILNLDYETFSETDLTRVGSHNYSKDETTEVLMCAYKFNGGRTEQWIPAEGQPMPAQLGEAMVDPEVQKWAWNSSFEMAITKHTMGMKVDLRQWRDTMILAHYCSFPGQLEKAGPAMGIPVERCKDPAGKRLMKLFSMMNRPRKKRGVVGDLFRVHWYDDLEKWEGYLAYNRRDADVEYEARSILIGHDLPMEEWQNWWMDQQINQAGLPINMRMVHNACKLYDEAYAQGFAEMQEVTGLANPNSTQQLLPWMKAEGYPFADCKAGHVRQALGYFKECPEHWEQDEWEGYAQNADLKDALSLRLELSKSSIKKFHALREATSPDGNLRNTLQFMGAARTARWAGRVFQPQNLPKPDKKYEKEIEIHALNVERCDLESIQLIYPNTFDLLASCIRPAAQAPDGYIFIDADLNAIENRVLGWLSGCEKILKVFEMGRDPYLDFATYLFHRDYKDLEAEYKAGDSTARTIAKPGVLGCGYMLGAGKKYEDRVTGEIEATGLLGYAWNMGVKQFTMEQSALSVKTFRREFKEVKDYWYAIERAAIRCVKTRTTQGCGQITFDIKGQFLRMELPSGRYLHYYKPKMQKTKMPWTNDDGSAAYKMSLTYEGQNDRKQWVRMSTHPGKLTENADQAISRDLLAHGMRLARQRKLDIRLHVHDENLALVKIDDAEKAMECLIESMAEPPVWAGGLPLGVAGYTSKVFKKD